MAYISKSNQEITKNPRKTDCPNILFFIQDTCRFCPGADTITEDAYEKYKRYCNDFMMVAGTYNVFARSFRYFLFHNMLVKGVLVHPVNYMHYKEGFGYVQKRGWAYQNLTINY